ncbi:MAG: right-handed parallel beta-helix repeat-containing protein, partial [Ignavibacteriaceae bacterium]
MRNLTIKNLYFILLILTLFSIKNTAAHDNTNNSFLFNGESSQLYVYDGQPANGDANQNGFKFFNKKSSNDKISVQATFYLIGDTPPDADIPIIYRTVNNGTTFSLYIKNNKGYFSIGNNNTATVNTDEFPAFQWVTLTGTYDGRHLKIFLNGTLAANINFSITPGYSYTNGTTGLFVGKSNEGVFKGLIDQITIYNDDDEPDHDNDDENSKYGNWSFTEISAGNLLVDQSGKKNNLHIIDITQVVPTNNLPFFVVTSTADDESANPGNGTAVSTNGQVTLRSAIQELNLSAGQHLVYFYIKGNAPQIQPSSVLPDIIQPIILDGTIQSGYSGTPLVEISGTFGGITLSGGESTVKGLAINNSSGFGLTLANTGGNNIANNQISGILITSANNNISNNSITTSSGDGVSITTGAGNILSFNSVSGNIGNGISIVSASGNSITNNTIGSNNLNGISVSNSAGIITGNTITGNNGLGLLLSASSGNQVTKNTIDSNKAGGISLANTNETIDGNDVSENLASGIIINASNNTLSNNVISGNSSNGITINGSSNKIVNDTVFSNGTSGTGAGISVETGNGNSILNNSIYNNSDLGIKLSASANNSLQSPVLNTLYTWQDETALPRIKGGIAIQGALNSTAGENYKIQFFANLNSSNSEGKRFVGETKATTDISGGAYFIANLKDVVLADGEVVSATASLLDNNGNPLSTSQFSPSISKSTDEGVHYKVNKTLSGIPLHWGDGKSTYQIANSIVNQGYDAQVQNGFTTWNTLNQLHYTRSSFQSNSNHWGGNADGINNIVWIPNSTEWEDTTGAPTDVTALTRIRYNALNGEITDADIAFNGQPISLTGQGQYYWATNGDTAKLDVQNVATHEIGHYSGLADLYNPGDPFYTLDMKTNNQGATMYGRID